MKSPLRKSRATGTELAKIDRAIRRGWEPGIKVGDVLARRSKRWLRRQEAMHE